MRLLLFVLALFATNATAQEKLYLETEDLSYGLMRFIAHTQGIAVSSLAKATPRPARMNQFQNRRWEKETTAQLEAEIQSFFNEYTGKTIEGVRFVEQFRYCKYFFDKELALFHRPISVLVDRPVNTAWPPSWASIKTNFGRWGTASPSIECLKPSEFAVTPPGVRHDLRGSMAVALSPEDAERLLNTLSNSTVPFGYFRCDKFDYDQKDHQPICLVESFNVTLDGYNTVFAWNESRGAFVCDYTITHGGLTTDRKPCTGSIFR